MATLTAPVLFTSDRERTPRPDLLLIIPLLALAALSVLMVWTASRPRLETLGIDGSRDLQRQMLFAAVGLTGFAAASLVEQRFLRHWAGAVYGFSLLALVVVFTPLGDLSRGAQRWVSLGAFQVQPSEFAKVGLIVSLAAFLAAAGEGRMQWKRVAGAVALTAVPAILVFQQPDLGTMLVFGFVVLVMLFIAGATVRQLVTLLAGAVAGLVGILQLGLLRTYQLERLTAFLDPTSDLQTANYNQFQSQVAIGSGQMFGKGILEGTQTNLSYVPAQTTDFVFTAVGEQLGFVGGVIVIGLYALIVWRLMMAAAASGDRFGRLLSAGVASLVAFHVFVNIGMTLGMMPVTGLPLPFMSEGGSSFLATATAMGLAHSVWMRRSRVPGERRLMG